MLQVEQRLSLTDVFKVNQRVVLYGWFPCADSPLMGLSERTAGPRGGGGLKLLLLTSGAVCGLLCCRWSDGSLWPALLR